MDRLEMDGSFPLTDEAIDAVVARASPGNYALGYMDGPSFEVFYVGRSDSDVRARLHGWVGTPSRSRRFTPPTRAPWGARARATFPFGTPAPGRVGHAAETGYTRFAYSCASSAAAAYEKECRNYYDFGGSTELDNANDPAAIAERTRVGPVDEPSRCFQPTQRGGPARRGRL